MIAVKIRKRSRRFESQKNANNFSDSVEGSVKDLRKIKDSKSNFKVVYTKESAQKRTFKVED